MSDFWAGILVGWGSTIALFVLLIWCLSRLRGWGEPVRDEHERIELLEAMRAYWAWRERQR